MKVSLSWLKDFVDIDVDLKTLADKMVSAGWEIEEIIEQGADMKNVVLGKITNIEKHPDSDHLQICKIDVNKVYDINACDKEGVFEDGQLQIVTGAQNIAVNDLVPVALPNSKLPNGMEIKKGKLRGVVSNGMLCSGEELKLTESDYKGASVYGIMIMNKETAPLGTDLNVIFGNDDVILDFGITANRPDCNSILGLAREVATVLNKPLKMPDFSFTAKKDIKVEDYVNVKVHDNDLCPRYIAAAVTNVKIGPSSEKIQKRLKSVGLRPICNIVDITNYVLIEIGQPMHSFDQDFLQGHEINVRRAENGEKITTLDEKENTLDNSMLVICDAVKPACVAGVMGGLNSGIKDTTKTVIFESAKFARDNIRRTARTLNLHSDSSFRYERGIDFESQKMGICRALHLIQEMNCGDIADGMFDILAKELKPVEIDTTVDEINSILGIDVPSDVIESILNRLQIKTTITNGKIHSVAPLFRDDIENANDLAEEVIRLYGYDKVIDSTMEGTSHTQGGLNQEQKNTKMIKEICVSNGYSECLTYSFISPKAYDILRIPQDSSLRNYVTLLNPLGEDMSVMRTTLSYSMLNNLATNSLKSIKEAKLFEVATVYEPKELPLKELPNEHQNLVIGSYGKNEDFYSIKAVVMAILDKFKIPNITLKRSNVPYLHMGKSACVFGGNNEYIGYIGEVHPEVIKSFDVKERLYLAEIDMSVVNKLASYKYKFEELGKFPPIERDLAVVVDEDVAVGDIIASVKKGGGNMLREVLVFDIYRNPIQLGENKKSVAINLVFRLPDRTLTDEEVTGKMNRIFTKLQMEFKAELRQ